MTKISEMSAATELGGGDLLELVQDIAGTGLDSRHVSLSELRAWIQAQPQALPAFAVAELPDPVPLAAGTMAYASDGLKTGEAAGAGTGVPVYVSGGAWRAVGTDQPVAA